MTMEAKQLDKSFPSRVTGLSGGQSECENDSDAP